MTNWIMQIFYLLASILFILGLKQLSSASTARRGNLISSLGMFLAVIVTLLSQEILSFTWIWTGLLTGSLAGVVFAKRVQMTAMPEMVALLNGFGGLSSLLVGWSIYHADPAISFFTALTIFLSVLIGGVTFTGSMIAWAKLGGKIPSKPLLFSGQQFLNIIVLTSLLVLGMMYNLAPSSSYSLFIYIALGSLALGVLSVIPIGGADMPVVISLLNSYSGLAACATGFVIQNNVLIVSGALVGASGIILTSIMCKAMNRSLSHVLFSGFGSLQQAKKTEGQKEHKSMSAKDAYFVLEAARSILVVPGYGLAVAQAQHTLKELAALFEKNGAEVKYAIHPVAGRMPGHMNVLLAEAGISYDQLIEMDDINPVIDTMDVCMVIGANDVVNLAAKEDKQSSIYGMPIIETHRAKNVFVLKRSMGLGFAGVENPLFFKDNTTMLFGDAKRTLQSLVQEMKA